MRTRLFFSICLSTIIILSLVATVPPSLAQDGNGLLTSDTVWTKANSPYDLSGPVAVNQGVTLTVEPGVVVNFNGYYIRVNGTLTAKGTSTDKITFNGGQFTFTDICNGWNEHTQSGCIIQNAVLNQVAFSTSNLIKIDSCTINGDISVSSGSIISNCVVNGDISVSSGSIISNCVVNGDIHGLMSTITGNSVKGGITVGSVTLGGYTTAEESSTVSGNIVEGKIVSGSPKGTPTIFGNSVSEGGIVCFGYGSIRNNYVHDSDVGISLSSMRVFGGFLACWATVENNLVLDNDRGIGISLSSMDNPGTMVPTIQQNTIAHNNIGMSLTTMNYDATPIIQNNNIMDNTQYNFYLSASNNVDASHNWWGTTDTDAIEQSIYDFNENFDYGTVTYQPILTATNPDAPTTPAAILNATPQPTTQPTPSPSVPEFPTAAAVAALILAVTVAAMLYMKKGKLTS